nr:MAG TPA: hypothetical protein [Caudoviricetes sp.]
MNIHSYCSRVGMSCDFLALNLTLRQFYDHVRV